MHLIGTEQIQSAANTMKEAAHEMHRAAGSIEYTLQQHKRDMEEFVVSMRDIMCPQLDKDGNRIP